MNTYRFAISDHGTTRAEKVELIAAKGVEGITFEGADGEWVIASIEMSISEVPKRDNGTLDYWGDVVEGTGDDDGDGIPDHLQHYDRPVHPDWRWVTFDEWLPVALAEWDAAVQRTADTNEAHGLMDPLPPKPPATPPRNALVLDPPKQKGK